MASTYVQTLEAELKAAQSQFGPKSLAAFHYSYLFAVFSAVDVLLNGPGELDTVLAALSAHAEIFCNVPCVSQFQAKSAQESSPLFTFDKAKYNAQYGVTATQFYDRFIDKLKWQPQFSMPVGRFAFVVSPEGQWRGFLEPMPMEICLLGRQQSHASYPAHPMLAEPFSLRVLLAGEMSYYWPKALGEPRLIYINSASGHFIPQVSSHRQALLVVSGLALSNEVSVISVAKDGVCVGGQLGSVLFP